MASGLAVLAAPQKSNEPIIQNAVPVIAPKSDGGGTISYGSIPGYEPHSVQRTVFAEDYTEWGCGPCASHNPAWTGAIEQLGYDVVAPSYVHVWWPAGTDPIYAYCNGDGAVQGRASFYGITYVPWPILDGTYIDYGQTQAAYVTAFNNRAAVPSPLIISTAGSLIDDPSNTGTMNLRITASDTITSTNLRVFVYLWEDSITRTLAGDSPPYPNGETKLDWAVWDIVPDDGGTAIWPTGAAAGSYVDINLPLTLGTDWVFANIGATVFVQDMTTHEVFQAKVETFDNVPPAVALTAPNPATAEQVLSGTIPITWTATDVEDAQATLDISIDYSSNGGSTWTNIISGTDNNIAPYTYNWNTVSAGIPDGTGYKVRVKATDSGGNYRYASSTEAFTIENVLNDEWYFQVEATGANKDLSVKPVENTENLAASASISATGEYKIGTWQTVQTFTGKNINGPWTFKSYGKTPNPGLVTLQAALYAKVFTSSNLVTPLDTTIYDDENVGAYTASHLFTWTDTLSGTITDGNTVVIEIWLHVTGGPYTQNSGSTTNSGFDTAATPWTYVDIEDAGPGTATGSWVGSGGNPGGMVQIALVSESTGSGSTAYPYSGMYQQSFTTSFVPFTATLAFDWKVVAANTVDPMTQYFYAYVETASGIPTSSPVWSIESVATAPTSWIHVNVDVSSIVNSATTYYVKVVYRHDSLQKGDGTYTGGYDNVLLSYARPYSIFYMEYDHGLTKSSVVPTIGTGVPVSVTANIPVVSGWNLVSIPIIATDTRLPYAMTDTVNAGAGLVVWDRAVSYNPLTTADPWKQYSKNWNSALNDLKDVDNKVGVWLFVTTLGDGVITVGGFNYTTPSTTAITLNTGWNLVGFPSDDTTYTVAMLKAACPTVTTVEQFDGGQTYKTSVMLDSANFAQGKAYWIYSSADTTWNKAW
jgi:hypothetical protein